MSTTLVRKEDVQRKWYVLDAADKPLGRTAVIAANLLANGDAGLTKTGAHTALADIRESIDELAYYRDNFLRLP